MEVVTHVIDIEKRKRKEKDDKWHLIFMGDFHVGNINFAEKYAMETKQWIKERDNVLILGMGDLYDAIPWTDNRFTLRSLDPRYSNVNDQRNFILNYFKDLVPHGNCLGYLEGNHEAKYYSLHGEDLTLDLCERLGERYLKTSALINLKFMKDDEDICSYKIFAAHGHYYGLKIGAALNKLKEISAYLPKANIVAMGHTHRIGVDKSVRLDLDDNNNLVQMKVLHILTGSFLESYKMGTTSYSEQRLYEPLRIGVVRVDLYPYSGDIHCSI